MSSTKRNTNHDSIASYYDLKGIEHHDLVVSCLEKLVFKHIPEGAHIFDLGCGSGQIAQRLLKRGYRVTGLDPSEGMLQRARENAPDGEFILDDARLFKLNATFHLAISTDHVLNYLLYIDELKDALKNVYESLLENGFFIFQLYIEELCEKNWARNDVGGGITDENVWTEIWSYDSENKIARKYTANFQLINGTWQRSNGTFLLKPYSTIAVESALKEIGFTEITIYDPIKDFGLEDIPDTGSVFMCRKQPNQ
ncbi:MAG: class I SAM-dependent methyltransferase [Nostoc sp.]|uniref:class I SAM-dependent DNA methyltransferase n=1 Tax=Nostoc sp. TaxID=1180 RepID=UPI002FFCF86A